MEQKNITKEGVEVKVGQVYEHRKYGRCEVLCIVGELIAKLSTSRHPGKALQILDCHENMNAKKGWTLIKDI